MPADPAHGGVTCAARDARRLLHTILGDAASARPPLIPFNRRSRRVTAVAGRAAGSTAARGARGRRRWSTARGRTGGAAEWPGRPFTMLVAIGYTGTRSGDDGPRGGFVLLADHVEWQLRGIRGRFFRLPPKDDSSRGADSEPLVPVDLPIFLAGLLTGRAAKHTRRRYACAREHGGTGRYMFYSPEGGTAGAATSRGESSALPGTGGTANGGPGNLVVADATAWPGPAAVGRRRPREPVRFPSGRGVRIS